MANRSLSAESGLSQELVVLSKNIDPIILGQRIKDARVAAGLTQGELAQGVVSTAYISRIESGQRRPDTALLQHIAELSRVSVDSIVLGVSRDEVAEMQLGLDFAELALNTGDPAQALERTTIILAQAEAANLPDLARTARFLRALALEATGSVNDAIILLEDFSEAEPHDLQWLKALIALSRCYRISGDLNMAIGIGKRAEEDVERLRLEGLGEAVQLTLTVAAAYHERGDIGYATRMCKRAIDQAEQMDSPLAKASAYWNASVMEWLRGNVSGALPLAEKAIILFEVADDACFLARMRNQLGELQLRADPPQADAAVATLQQAQQELDFTGANPEDKALNLLRLAHAHFLLGHTDEAEVEARACREAAGTVLPIVAAETIVLLGQMAAARAETEESRRLYQEAIILLSGVGADREAAELWFELAGLLEGMGDYDQARDAYKRAAASTGLTRRAVQPSSEHKEASVKQPV